MGTGLRWSHVLFLGSTWAVVSLLALVVGGWPGRSVSSHRRSRTRAQRQEIVRVLARLADAQVRDKLDSLGPLAAHFGRTWAEYDPRRAGVSHPPRTGVS